jgi:hypothetical protein
MDPPHRIIEALGTSAGGFVRLRLRPPQAAPLLQGRQCIVLSAATASTLSRRVTAAAAQHVGTVAVPDRWRAVR